MMINGNVPRNGSQMPATATNTSTLGLSNFFKRLFSGFVLVNLYKLLLISFTLKILTIFQYL